MRLDYARLTPVVNGLSELVELSPQGLGPLTPASLKRLFLSR